MEDLVYKFKIRKWTKGRYLTTEQSCLFLFLFLFVFGSFFTGCGYSSIPFTPQNCTVSKVDTTSTVSCPDGSSVVIPDGSTGIAGPAGANGTNGTNGTPGTVVSFVQFCPGVQLVNFPEQGICINGNIYAVYWNGATAFGTLLTPRQYTTTAISGNCTFTVGANCSVTNP